MNALIRQEEPRDRKRVGEVNEAAFGRSDEADLVKRLREEGAVLLSLVAELEGRVIGHILFSRMTVETEQSSVKAVSLAPLAVVPDVQRKGVGSDLVRRGLVELRKLDEAVVIVLGHPEYYSRFGFSVEGARNLVSPFPANAFMALELRSGALTGVSGRVKYATAFGLEGGFTKGS